MKFTNSVPLPREEYAALADEVVSGIIKPVTHSLDFNLTELADAALSKDANYSEVFDFHASIVSIAARRLVLERGPGKFSVITWRDEKSRCDFMRVSLERMETLGVAIKSEIDNPPAIA